MDLNAENFRSEVGVEGIVLVLCWGPGCGACQAMEPAWGRVAKKYERHAFARLNVVAEEDLGIFFEIEHTPTLMLYRDGLLLLKKAAKYTEEELTGIIAQAEGLDMDRVRSDLAEIEAAKPE